VSNPPENKKIKNDQENEIITISNQQCCVVLLSHLSTLVFHNPYEKEKE
jgi:hypothetical protein